MNTYPHRYIKSKIDENIDTTILDHVSRIKTDFPYLHSLSYVQDLKIDRMSISISISDKDMDLLMCFMEDINLFRAYRDCVIDEDFENISAYKDELKLRNIEVTIFDKYINFKRDESNTSDQ